MKKYVVYGIGAALVDTEIRVRDDDLARMRVDKGLMTLVDENRQSELLGLLQGHLVEASHASGGSAGNSMIATAQFGGPTFMSCKVADDADGDIYLADLAAAGVEHCLNGERAPGTTGKCLVLITPDAERSMNTFLGVSSLLEPDDVDGTAYLDALAEALRPRAGVPPATDPLPPRPPSALDGVGEGELRRRLEVAEATLARRAVRWPLAIARRLRGS